MIFKYPPALLVSGNYKTTSMVTTSRSEFNFFFPCPASIAIHIAWMLAGLSHRSTFMGKLDFKSNVHFILKF